MNTNAAMPQIGMKMDDFVFAKLFQHEVYGQILVRTTQDDDSPAIAVRIDIGGRDNSAEIFLGYEDDQGKAATEIRDEKFDGIDESAAFDLAADIYKTAAPMYAAADDDD